MKKAIHLIILFSFLFFQSLSLAQAAPLADIDIVMFEGEGCPHCAKMHEAIETLKQTSYSQINLIEYEVYHDSDNQKMMFDYAQAYGFVPAGVPVIFIGHDYIEGEDIAGLNQLLANCQIQSCPSPQTIVEEYYKEQGSRSKDHNNDNQGTNQTATLVGWGILILMVVVGLVVLVVKMQGRKNRSENNSINIKNS